MWPAIRRARRRLRDGSGLPAMAGGGEPAAPGVVDVEDVVIVLGQAEVALLLIALETELGDAVDRPDTPARLERALATLLAGRGEPGQPRVLRRPAALSAPESWEIHLDGVMPATGVAVRAAGRSGVFAA
jgi:hypothetical protein